MFLRLLVFCLALSPCLLPVAADSPDKFQWLENVSSARSMAWVRDQDKQTLSRLQADPRYQTFFATALRFDEAPDRIPEPMLINGAVYNFWQDATHAQGVLRRTSLARYKTRDPSWTIVLDLDQLSKQEGKHWVWKGIDCLEPAETRCLISLSNGGEDAVTTREFDLSSMRFVPGGFALPRAKQEFAWQDADHLIVATDWGPGSMTHSGYPFIVKQLARGQTLADAKEIFRGTPADVSVEIEGLSDAAGDNRVVLERGLDFFHSETRLVTGTATELLDLPQKLTIEGLVHDELVFTSEQDFASHGGRVPAGALAAIDLAAPKAKPALIFVPAGRQTVDNAFTTRGALVAAVLDNVRGRAMVFTPEASGWRTRTLPLPENASIELVASSPRNDFVFIGVTGFLLPSTLYADDVATSRAPETVKALPARFAAAADSVDQYEATSKDGTKIPYFLVHPKAMTLDGVNPTLLEAYGGFQISMTPYYSARLGALWLARGGVYALANIRGGGEFGPAWHEAALKTHRYRAYDDFAAVARDMMARRITDPAHLGIRGGSNGGLLMGVEMTEHPDLWKAVIIDVPLLDMLRYEKIAAGASWVGEYGSVSVPAVRAFWEKTSPYQNLHQGVDYPEPFIFTTTKDDRVGPAHARKFAARLAAMGKPYYYDEAIEGGHASGANLREDAVEQALEYTYLSEKLMGNGHGADH